MQRDPNRWRKQSFRWWLGRLPFALVHLSPLALFWTGITTRDVILCVALYVIRMFFVTAGYHRYFSHRAFKTSRFGQFVLALGAQSSLQKGVLWWAAHHRHHHRYSDTPEDIHSPKRGFLYSHILWVADPLHKATAFERVKDLARFPELRFLNRWHWLPAIALGTGCFLMGGWSALVGGFFLSTVILYHGTYCINSLTHMWGTRRYETGDMSRNNFFLSVITLGEGWHNNHHHTPGRTAQGERWWEIDPTYGVLRVAELLGLVSDVRTASAAA
ncbi:MAG TPA: acyl-CoA desaturase [Candidatus Krumholzibacteria bacterium]|jgi:stearoyl-CoA desaturase (delta-9 desaturase)